MAIEEKRDSSGLVTGSLIGTLIAGAIAGRMVQLRREKEISALVQSIKSVASTAAGDTRKTLLAMLAGGAVGAGAGRVVDTVKQLRAEDALLNASRLSTEAMLNSIPGARSQLYSYVPQPTMGGNVMKTSMLAKVAAIAGKYRISPDIIRDFYGRRQG